MTFHSLYGGQGSAIPNSVYKKLPRIINGIPLGAGRLSQSQASDIQWRLVEGPRDLITFLSMPICWEDAEETRQALKDRLVRQAKQVFGDITVKTNIILSQCLHFDADFYVNDIADSMEEGLHFYDWYQLNEFRCFKSMNGLF